jgi:hypothetical protein
MFNVVIDNDIVQKICLYGFDGELTELLCQSGLVAAVLPVARYVVQSRLRRLAPVDKIDANDALERLLSHIIAVEPDADELELAAAFESEALRQNLELDGGESQLLAMMLTRDLRLLMTGDKRAVRAIDRLADHRLPARFVCCLEQLVLVFVRRLGVAFVREHVCKKPAADKAMATCFACHSSVSDTAAVVEGLCSFIEDLRKSARRVLIAADDLSRLVA